MAPKTFSEPSPDPYRGEYNELLSTLMKHTWIAVVYMTASVLLVYAFSFIGNPIVLATIAEVPLFAMSFYVVSPNQNLTWRLPPNWILTALLAGFAFASSEYHWSSIEAGNAVGAIWWLFVLYWLTSAVVWSLQLRATTRVAWSTDLTMNFVATILITWGAILQVAFLVSWLFLPHFSSIYKGSPVMESLLMVVGLIESTALIRFLPIAPFLLGLIVFGSLKLREEPYSPKSIDEVLPFKDKSLLASFILAIRIPVWIVIVIVGFVGHLAMILLKQLREFGRFWLARLTFIIVGLVLAPTLLYFGHSVLFSMFAAVSRHMTTPGMTLGDSLLSFLWVNFLAIVALSSFVLSIPLLSAHYRGESIDTFLSSLHYEVFVLGNSSANAVGQTFSLLGVIAFAVPVAALLPGGSGFGTFSFLYTLGVLSFLGYYFFTTVRDRE